MGGGVNRSRKRVRVIRRMRRGSFSVVVFLVARERLVGAAGKKEGAADRSENKCEFHIWNLMVGRFREALGEIVALLNLSFSRTRVRRRVLVRIGATREESQNKQCEQRFHGSEVYPASSIAPAAITANYAKRMAQHHRILTCSHCWVVIRKSLLQLRFVRAVRTSI
jgi:hypothetical protein